jgi:aryl-alcohol dehydrogenase-like predicted oxidoreductase
VPIAADLGTTPDTVALAEVLAQRWASVVLSGAATGAQLASNLRATDLDIGPDRQSRLAALAEPSNQYWQTRSRMSWA